MRDRKKTSLFKPRIKEGLSIVSFKPTLNKQVKYFVAKLYPSRISQRTILGKILSDIENSFVQFSISVSYYSNSLHTIYKTNQNKYLSYIED